MTRQLRIEYEGAYYHVYSRGNAGCDIFITDEDRQDFLNLLNEMSDRFDADVYAYVLMTNHYHILLRTRKANLSKCMQWLGTGYTRRFNLRNSRSGHLFQGRFKGILVENDSYLMQLSCYIHRNPLRAGMVKRLADYKWSSYSSYAYKRIPSGLLDTGLVFSYINAKDKHRAYREKVQRYSDEEGRIWEDVKYGLIYGSQAFQEYIKDRCLSGQPDSFQYSLDGCKELPQLKRLLKEEDPGILLSKSAGVLGCDIEAYKSAARLSGDDRDKRDVLLYLLWKTGKYTNSQIGSLLGLTFSSVSRRANHVKATLGVNKVMKDSINKVNAIIKV